MLICPHNLKVGQFKRILLVFVFWVKREAPARSFHGKQKDEFCLGPIHTGSSTRHAMHDTTKWSQVPIVCIACCLACSVTGLLPQKDLRVLICFASCIASNVVGALQMRIFTVFTLRGRVVRWAWRFSVARLHTAGTAAPPGSGKMRRDPETKLKIAFWNKCQTVDSNSKTWAVCVQMPSNFPWFAWKFNREFVVPSGLRMGYILFQELPTHTWIHNRTHHVNWWRMEHLAKSNHHLLDISGDFLWIKHRKRTCMQYCMTVCRVVTTLNGVLVMAAGRDTMLQAPGTPRW